MKNINKGFTLIELLIVIALLGALAVGLLAALDPFEQLKKGTDTGVRNTVSEMHGAVLRYYAIKSNMPWCAVAACTSWRDVAVTSETVSGLTLTGLTNTIIEIAASGELKNDFSTLAGAVTLGKIKVYGSNTSATLKVCYSPSAKSFINDPNTKFLLATGVESVTCKGAGGADLTCMWCVQ